MNNKSNVYELVDSSTGNCFYVGKGSGQRYKVHGINLKTKKANSYLYNTLVKLKNQNIFISYNFPYQNLTDEEAFQLEIELIDFHGLNNLCNFSKGGLGSWVGENNPLYGKTLSLEHRQKLSLSHQGLTHTEEWKKKMSVRISGENQPLFGKTFSKDSREKMSQSHKIRHYSLVTEFKKGCVPWNKGKNKAGVA